MIERVFGVIVGVWAGAGVGYGLVFTAMLVLHLLLVPFALPGPPMWAWQPVAFLCAAVVGIWVGGIMARAPLGAEKR